MMSKPDCIEEAQFKLVDEMLFDPVYSNADIAWHVVWSLPDVITDNLLDPSVFAVARKAVAIDYIKMISDREAADGRLN